MFIQSLQAMNTPTLRRVIAGKAVINKPSSPTNRETHTLHSSHRSRVPIGAQSQQWNTVPITERYTVALCSQIHVYEKEDEVNCSLA